MTRFVSLDLPLVTKLSSSVATSSMSHVACRQAPKATSSQMSNEAFAGRYIKVSSTWRPQSFLLSAICMRWTLCAMKWFALCSLLAFTGLARFASPSPSIPNAEHTNSHAPAPHQLNRRDDIDPALLYPEHNISVPVDHFFNESKYEPHTNATFNLRYWFDKTYYKPGGPVIVLQGGETDGSGRLPYLQKGKS
jgi:hypothetical protein